jgi:hypothetical protein
MTEIIDAIDAQLDARFKDRGLKSFGLCELVKRQGQVMPVKIENNGEKRSQVALDDKWNGIVYHRLISGASSPDEDSSFGARIAKRQVARIRTVLATKLILGEAFRFEFANALPETLTIDNYKLVDVSENLTMIEDQEGIYAQEFGGGDYEKHILPWNINAFEYDVEFIRCFSSVLQ